MALRGSATWQTTPCGNDVVGGSHIYIYMAFFPGSTIHLYTYFTRYFQTHFSFDLSDSKYYVTQIVTRNAVVVSECDFGAYFEVKSLLFASCISKMSENSTL